MMSFLINTIFAFFLFIMFTVMYWIKRAIGMNIPIKVRKKCSISKNKFKNRRVYIIENKEDVVPDMYIIYLHGGSYVASFGKEHWHTFSALCQDLNAKIIAPDYPLTPKSTYVDVFDMIEPLYMKIINKVPKDKLIVMGDSSGGGMALSLMEKISNDSKSLLPKKVVLISPWLDVLMNNPDIDKIKKKDKVLNKTLLKVAGKMYIGKGNSDNFLTSPIKGEIQNIDNLVIFTGTYDILNPDVHVLFEKYKKCSKTFILKETYGAGHIWILRKYKNKYQSIQDYNELIKILKDV